MTKFIKEEILQSLNSFEEPTCYNKQNIIQGINYFETQIHFNIYDDLKQNQRKYLNRIGLSLFYVHHEDNEIKTLAIKVLNSTLGKMLIKNIISIKLSQALQPVTNFEKRKNSNSKTIQQFYYAVKIGRNPGIYNTWYECNNQVMGYSKCIFKKFDNLKEAKDFLKL